MEIGESFITPTSILASITSQGPLHEAKQQQNRYFHFCIITLKKPVAPQNESKKSAYIQPYTPPTEHQTTPHTPARQPQKICEPSPLDLKWEPLKLGIKSLLHKSQTKVLPAAWASEMGWSCMSRERRLRAWASLTAASLFPVGGVCTKGVQKSGQLLAEGNKNNHPRGTFHLTQKIKPCKKQEPHGYEFTLGKKNQSMFVCTETYMFNALQ